MSSATSTPSLLDNPDSKSLPSSSQGNSVDSRIHRQALSAMDFLSCISRSLLVILMVAFYLWSITFLVNPLLTGLASASPKDFSAKSTRIEHGVARSMPLQSAGTALSTSRSWMMTVLLPLLVLSTQLQPNLLLWGVFLQPFPAALAYLVISITPTPPPALKGAIAGEAYEATSSANEPESRFLGPLLVGIALLMLLHMTIERPRMVVLLFAILAQIPTVAAMDGGVYASDRTENRQLRTGLSPEAQWMIEFFSWIYAFGIVCRCILGLFRALDVLIPFLPVYFALKDFANMWFADHQTFLDQAADSRTISKWIFILPIFVLFYCANRNPQRTRLYFCACCIAIMLGVGQTMIASRQSLQPLWLLQTVNAVITASHLGVWYFYLVVNRIGTSD
jgi:hypothetical protein